jgi:hypothetical protein
MYSNESRSPTSAIRNSSNENKDDDKYKYYLITLTQFQGQDGQEISVGPKGFR